MEPEPFDDVEAGLMMDGFEDEIRWWHPRQALRNTNWLHRTDALRVRDLRTLQMLQYQAQRLIDASSISAIVHCCFRVGWDLTLTADVDG